MNGVRRVRCTLLSCLALLALGCGGQAPVLSEGKPGGDGSAAEPVEAAAAPTEEAARTAPAAERAMVLVAEGTFIIRGRAANNRRALFFSPLFISTHSK